MPPFNRPADINRQSDLSTWTPPSLDYRLPSDIIGRFNPLAEEAPYPAHWPPRSNLGHSAAVFQHGADERAPSMPTPAVTDSTNGSGMASGLTQLANAIRAIQNIAGDGGGRV